MPETKFTKEYFIKKFEAIPDHRWTTGFLKIIIDEPDKPLEYKCCAAGHCGVKDGVPITEEAAALSLLFNPIQSQQPRVFIGAIICINDDKDNDYGFGTTPKERILNKLKSL